MRAKRRSSTPPRSTSSSPYCSAPRWPPTATALASLFFFNDTATTEIYTLSLHDALPIFTTESLGLGRRWPRGKRDKYSRVDRKSTRLNSSHDQISYAVFCLKKKKNK